MCNFGITLIVRIRVIYDDEARVYIATSTDVDGLVLEAETYDILKKEAEEMIPVLLALNHKRLRAKTAGSLVFRDQIVLA
ncbi:MAG: DUF1902 domain-containing protein [Methylococcaceae bacterium]|nr:MAG: DUF1902 domain-containing protein [Methylococcaceae bacterium]